MFYRRLAFPPLLCHHTEIGRARMDVARILKVAFILSVGMYAVIAFMLGSGPRKWPSNILRDLSGAF